jgi:hypothetical protein
LPSDFLRLNEVRPRHHEYSIEGQRLRSNSDGVYLSYVRDVTDPDEFDALFMEVLTVKLASKLVMPLLQDKMWKEALEAEFLRSIAKARLVSFSENKERVGGPTWNEARSRRIP